jgi:hypothetical protein
VLKSVNNVNVNDFVDVILVIWRLKKRKKKRGYMRLDWMR